MIDVNQQRFFMLSKPGQLDLEDQVNSVEWNEALQVLRLRSRRTLEEIPSDRQRAKALADQLPVTMDTMGTWARVDETGESILAGGVLPDPVVIFTVPSGERISDMTMNPEGMLYVISRNSDERSTVYLINLRYPEDDGKTVTIHIPNGESQPDRIVALSQGGALLLDRKSKKFRQIIGKPLRAQPTAIFLPETPRPCADGPETQRQIERPDLILPLDYEAVDMASNPDNEVAVLMYPVMQDEPAAVVLISCKGVSAPVLLDRAIAPYSIGWIGNDGWALLFDDKKEAFAYPVSWRTEPLKTPVCVWGQRYPLNWGAADSGKNKKFVNGLSCPAQYQSSDKEGYFLLRPLHALSYPSYATNAEIKIKNIIDIGEPNTIWHRLILEANIPKGTGVIISLKAGENIEEVKKDEGWAEHHFGAVPVKPDVPRGIWLKDASESPFFKGMLCCLPRSGTAGVFDVLIQRAGYTERTIKGRYLNVKIELIGGGNSTPEIAALRFYHPRFSYLDRYLPELYREIEPGRKAEEPGNACGPDFLRRLLCMFEGVLTPLENKVAASYMLTNPESAPADVLDWLGQWIGPNMDMDLTEKQKRAYIQNATKLYRRRGTMKGLAMILDLVTDNMVKRGDIFLLEDFRLRRTFATILGADFSVKDDPLLMDTIPSANSYVGETMFLGEEEKKEFLAIYARDIPLNLNNQEQETIDNFYARLANRLTVLVHDHTDSETLGMISRVVTLEIPSHIDFRVVSASRPLLIGMYSLLGVDTYMKKEQERRTARLGYSYLGRYDFIRKLPVLDYRLEP